VITLALAYLLLFAPPAIVAAIPGGLLFFWRRPRLAFVMIVGALLATIPLPYLLNWFRMRGLMAQGITTVDDFTFIFIPWVCAFWYFVFGLIVLGVCHEFGARERE